MKRVAAAVLLLVFVGATSAPGQSGQPGSPHYDDPLPLWQAGEYFPLAFTRARMEKATRHRVALTRERK